MTSVEPVAITKAEPLLETVTGSEYEKKFRVPWKEVQKAIDQGYIIPGWSLADYVNASVKGNPNDVFARHGIVKLGYENVNIWGMQGATKSNLMWQLLNVLYQDWSTSFDRMVVTLPDLLSNYALVKGVNRRLPGLGVDDFTSLVPKQLWFVDKDLHILLQQFLAVLRTKIGTIATTTPNIEFTWESLGEVVTIEIIIYPNQTYKAERYCWDVDPEHPLKARFTKIVIENARYDPLAIPRDWWNKYQVKREGMADSVFDKLVTHWSKSDSRDLDVQKKMKRRLFKEMVGPGKSRTIEELRARGVKGNTEKIYQILGVLEEMFDANPKNKEGETP